MSRIMGILEDLSDIFAFSDKYGTIVYRHSEELGHDERVEQDKHNNRIWL